MISAWLHAAMGRAKYDFSFDDDGVSAGYIGKIPECQIVLASGVTLELCREELLSRLEDWLLFRLRNGMSIPEFDGVGLDAVPLPVGYLEEFEPVSNG